MWIQVNGAKKYVTDDLFFLTSSAFIGEILQNIYYIFLTVLFFILGFYITYKNQRYPVYIDSETKGNKIYLFTI